MPRFACDCRVPPRARDALANGQDALDALVDAAAKRGLRLTTDWTGSAAHTISAVLMCAEQDETAAQAEEAAARATGAPVLQLEQSWFDNHLRLAELSRAAGVTRDKRLARLFNAHGHLLDDDTVAACASLAPHARNASRSEDNGHGPARQNTIRLAGEIGAPWRAAFHAEPVCTLIDRDGPVPAVMCQGPVEVWHALSAGFEVITLGHGPFDGTGLTHPALRPEDLPAAIASVAEGPRNHRDLFRRLLATERLYNAAANTAHRLAALLDEAVRAVGRSSRRTVSVVVTNFNYADFLDDALGSLRRQTVAPHEIIVVDDGSTNGSAERIGRMSDVISVLKPNGGQASAFNAGFVKTSGDIVVFLDADDRLHPNAIETLGMADWRDVSRLSFGLETIDRAGRPTGLYEPIPCGPPPPQGYLAGAVMANGIVSFMPTSGNAFPRHVLQNILPLPEAPWRISADLPLVLDSAFYGEARRLAAVLGDYRIHGDNGYFTLLGAAPHLEPKRIAQRTAAWRSLQGAPPKILSLPMADRLRIGMRALLHGAEQRTTLRGRAKRLGAAALAATAVLRASSLSAGAKLRALGAVARGLRGGPMGGATAPWLTPFHGKAPPLGAPSSADLLFLAGPASWPMVSPGKPLVFDDPAQPADVLGFGWVAGEPDGARLCNNAGTLAFRLCDTDADWRLTFGFHVRNEACPLPLTVTLNGHLVDVLRVQHSGELTVDLPRSCLLPWQSIVPESRLGAVAAAITLTLGNKGAGAFTLGFMEVNPNAPALTPYPAVPFAITLGCVAPSDERPSLSDLAFTAGWSWRSGRGVTVEGGCGILSITAHASCSVALVAELSVTPTPGERAAAGPPVELMVNETRLDTVLRQRPPRAAENDGCADFILTANIAAHHFGQGGRLRLGFVAPPSTHDGTLPRLALSTLRLDPTHGRDGVAHLTPNKAVPFAALLGHFADTSGGPARRRRRRASAQPPLRRNAALRTGHHLAPSRPSARHASSA